MSINKKRELFSNIYSPRNQSPFNKTLQLRRDKSSLTPTKTQRSQRDHVVASIPSIQTYRHATKLTLTEQGMKKILKQLQIQAQVRRSLQQRIKSRDLYIKYDINPLTSQFNKGNKGQQQSGKEVNIFEAITKSSNKIQKGKIKQKLEPYENRPQLAYANLLKKRMKQYSKTSQGKMQPLIWKKQQQAQPQHYEPNYLQQLNDIMKINQPSYFQRLYRKRQHNIFELVYRNEANFLSSREILNQYYFCHDSIFTHTQKSGPSHKLVLQEISIFSRDMIRGIKNQYINDRIALGETDLTLEVERLSFNELMLLNTGRVSSKTLLNYLQGDQMERPRRNLDEDDDNSSAQQMEYPIMYADNTKNHLLNYNPVLVTKEDISEYNKIQRSPFQKKQQDLSYKFQEKLKRLIELQRKLVSNTIKDKDMMATIKNEKDRTILQQIENNADVRYNLDLKEIERRMRLNKVGKNRSERIKIDIVNETFRLRRNQEVRKSMKRRKSVSPNGTIRK